MLSHDIEAHHVWLCSNLPGFVICVTSLGDGNDILAAETYSLNLLSREKQDCWAL